MRLRRWSPRVLALQTLVALCACEDTAVVFVAEGTPNGTVIWEMGEDPQLDARFEVGVPVAGAVSPSGTQIAILDAVAPHLRLLDRNGQPRDAYLGDTLTSTQPRPSLSSIGLGEKTALVGDAAARALLLIDLTTHHVQLADSLGIRPFGALAFTDSTFVVYGPDAGDGESAQPRWFHCVSWSTRSGERSRPRIRSSEALATHYDSVRTQMTASLSRVGESALMIHRTAEGPVLVRVGCLDDSAKVEKVADLRSCEPRSKTDDASAVVTSFVLESGVATLVRAPLAGTERATEWTHCDAAATRTRRRGMYKALAADEQTVLWLSAVPFSNVQLVRNSDRR